MIIGFIPLRVGSKSIPLKNIKELNGKPLAQYIIDSSNLSRHINKTVVSIDSKILLDKINNTDVFWRTSETATDTATSESALIEFCETRDLNDIIVFLQATSPLIKSSEIDSGIELILRGEYDSIVSVVRQKRFIWVDNKPSYDPLHRPRRQDFDGYLVENGGFYISRVSNILESKCRFSGKIGLCECSPDTYYELDEPNDWYIIEGLLKNKIND